MQIVAQRGGHGRSDLPEPPFVGREHELRVLKDLVGAGEPAAQLVSITGPGGIGKSRLAWELLKYIDGIAGDIYWHRGRSPSYGDGIAFWALGEMVRRRAGLAEDDTAETTRDRIRATVVEFVPEDEDRRWVEPALLTLLGVEPPPAGGRDVLFAGWRIFFERIAEHGPTILLFEDLQWADAGLLDFIEHLLEWSRRRPDPRGDPRPARAVRPSARLGERNAPPHPHRARAAGRTRDAPAPDRVRAGTARATPGRDRRPRRRDAAVRRRDSCASLVADGRIALVDGVYRLTGELGRAVGPGHAPEPDRVAGSTPSMRADRSLVADAAVLGQVFTVGGLAAVSGLRSDDARAAPPDRSFATSCSTSRWTRGSPERGQYRFVQA